MSELLVVSVLVVNYCLSRISNKGWQEMHLKRDVAWLLVWIGI